MATGALPAGCSLLALLLGTLLPLAGRGLNAESGPTAGDPFLCQDPSRRDLLLPASRLCDGLFDCLGDVDETNCTACGRGAWKCVTSRRCIPELGKCNGVPDCEDASDEEPARCLDDACPGQSRFKCANGECVHRFERCDGVAVCSDGSDEHDCCRPDEFRCWLDEGRPRCDGVQDCDGGEDEADCAGELVTSNQGRQGDEYQLPSPARRGRP
ncbi:low-density lipoprotein receptor-like [Pollicipes pollicipes]|uniref:low-density lipoprotein receptor-like n=1 Tax=Pollicipes pollicipes TaxID=41117 RepID=UPI0018855259|nr:low-density lipoprotein receptor-like [Pollicipes pollicipes]